MSVSELLDASVEFLKKDIIPDTGNIHGVVCEESKVLDSPAPSEETFLEAVKEAPLTKSPSHGKKKIHRSPSLQSNNHENSSSHHNYPPWHAKWEMSRQTHNYGINHQFHQGVRRNTATSVHVNTQRIQAEYKHHHRKHFRPSIHSVVVDNGNGPVRQVPIPSEESLNSSSGSWIGALGSIFWGSTSLYPVPPSSPTPFSRPIEVDGSPAGNYRILEFLK